jgi:ABC-2 type transport system permease protein
LVKRLNQAGTVGFEEAGVAIESRVWFNPNLESRLFYVPAVIALVAFLIPIILTAQAVVREREIGTLEQIMVTPIRSWELVVGKTAPFAMLGVLDMIRCSDRRLLVWSPLNRNLVLFLGASCS